MSFHIEREKRVLQTQQNSEIMLRKTKSSGSRKSPRCLFYCYRPTTSSRSAAADWPRSPRGTAGCRSYPEDAGPLEGRHSRLPRVSKYANINSNKGDSARRLDILGLNPWSVSRVRYDSASSRCLGVFHAAEVLPVPLSGAAGAVPDVEEAG